MTDAFVAQAKVTEEQARVEVDAFCQALYLEMNPDKMTGNELAVYEDATRTLMRACVRGSVIFDPDTSMPKVLPRGVDGFSDGLVFRQVNAADLVPPSAAKAYSDEQRVLYIIGGLTGHPPVKIGKLLYPDFKVCSAIVALFTLG